MTFNIITLVSDYPSTLLVSLLFISYVIYEIYMHYQIKKGEVKVIEHYPINLAHETIHGLEQKASRLYISGDYNKAIGLCHSILLKKRDSLSAYQVMAMCNNNLGNKIEAIVNYLEVLRLDHNDWNTAGQLGILYHQIGDYGKGQKYLKLSIDLGSDMYKGLYELESKYPSKKYK